MADDNSNATIKALKQLARTTEAKKTESTPTAAPSTKTVARLSKFLGTVQSLGNTVPEKDGKYLIDLPITLIVGTNEERQEHFRQLLELLLSMSKDSDGVVCKSIVSQFLAHDDFVIELTAAFNQIGYELKAIPPVISDPVVGEIRSDYLHGWREVNAARSRAHRANLTPEKAAHESEQGTRRVAAFRERMTPEQRAARSAKEAERLRSKRALAKAPKP